ncbi:hypothetical protein PCANC_06666 [Puccinia coronata f. sp. avenae]|uniref:Uncharacterized protein n=1 Tax=Puccinia coronata f. sp. avenae TaxID=200324 RepID=A0A2N5VUC7_9BASI|nr:hypothetical protein PCANC_06666 [Puccinia coronata f. sp. avenae]
MLDPRVDMIQFVFHLPPSVNPYEAVAGKIRHEINLRGDSLSAELSPSSSSCTVVLWLRHRDKRLHFFRFNKLGLIHVELLNEVVLLMLIYSFCAFLDLSTQEFVERGLLRYSTKLTLHTTKFSISVAVSWCEIS